MTLEKRIERLEERLKSRKKQPIPQDVIEEFLKYTNASATNRAEKERTGNAVRYTRTHQSAPKPLQSKEACKQRHSEGLECTKKAHKGENVPLDIKGNQSNPSNRDGSGKGGNVQNITASPSTSQKLSTKRLNDAFGQETP